MSSRTGKSKKSKSRGKRDGRDPKGKSKGRSNGKSRGKAPTKSKKVKRAPKPLTEEERQQQAEIARELEEAKAKEEERLRELARDNIEFERHIVNDVASYILNQPALSQLQNEDDIDGLDFNEERTPNHQLSAFINALLHSESQMKNLHSLVISICL